MKARTITRRESASMLLLVLTGTTSVLCGAAPDTPIRQRTPGDAAPDHPRVVKADTTVPNLANALRQIASEERDCYHRLLWRAYHLTKNSMKGQRWDEVAEALAKQGLTPTRPWNTRETHGQVEYTVPGAGYKAEGQVHNLYVRFYISKEISETTPTYDRVRWANVRLHLGSATRLDQAVQQQWYAKGSALDRALQCAEVQKAAKRLPILKEIDVEYGYLGNHRIEVNPSGFTTRITLVDDAKQQNAGRSLYVHAISGLDPSRDHAGKPETPEFSAYDTISESWADGSGSYWGENGERQIPHLSLSRLDRPVKDYALNHPESWFPIAYSPADVKVLPRTAPALIVKNHELSRATILALKDLPALEALDIEWENLDVETLTEIAKFPALTRLWISASGGGPLARDLTDGGLEQICKIKGLKELSIRNCTGLTDAGFRSLRDLKNLTSLSLGSCEHLTDAALKPVSELHRLKKLDLSGCKQISDQGLEHLGNLTGLERFSFSHCETATAAGYAHLAKLTKLQELTLAWSPINDEGFAAISKLTNLREVSFYGLKITDDGLKRLGQLKNLQEVWLNDLDITDAGLTYLEELPDVRRLVIQSKRLTDAGLSRLHSKLPGRFE